LYNIKFKENSFVCFSLFLLF